jgi:hypothetical protein
VGVETKMSTITFSISRYVDSISHKCLIERVKVCKCICIHMGGCSGVHIKRLAKCLCVATVKYQLNFLFYFTFLSYSVNMCTFVRKSIEF